MSSASSGLRLPSPDKRADFTRPPAAFRTKPTPQKRWESVGTAVNGLDHHKSTELHIAHVRCDIMRLMRLTDKTLVGFYNIYIYIRMGYYGIEYNACFQ